MSQCLPRCVCVCLYSPCKTSSGPSKSQPLPPNHRGLGWTSQSKTVQYMRERERESEYVVKKCLQQLFVDFSFTFFNNHFVSFYVAPLALDTFNSTVQISLLWLLCVTCPGQNLWVYTLAPRLMTTDKKRLLHHSSSYLLENLNRNKKQANAKNVQSWESNTVYGTCYCWPGGGWTDSRQA